MSTLPANAFGRPFRIGRTVVSYLFRHPTNCAEIRIRGDDDSIFTENSRQDMLLCRRLRRMFEACQTWWQGVVIELFQAVCGRVSSRSIAEAAAKRKHSRISSLQALAIGSSYAEASVLVRASELARRLKR